MKIFLTGSSGFIGRNLSSKFKNIYKITSHKRGEAFDIKQDCVIHLAGISHDIIGNYNANIYNEVNYKMTKDIYNSFLSSNAEVFIFISSTKAVADKFDGILNEDTTPNPQTLYGKSKLAAEKYILSKMNNKNKRVYILRPCMVHGIGNKGNLNLLYNWVKIFPFWPLASYKNKRSYCSIENLIFIINELILQKKISSGVYNIADDNYISTRYIISKMYKILDKNYLMINLSPRILKIIALIGDKFGLFFNNNTLDKLTANYCVSNNKILKAMDKDLPISSEAGMSITINSLK